MTVLNPRDAAGALNFAHAQYVSQSAGWDGVCDHAVALDYGWGHSGEVTAHQHWLDLVATGHAHPKAPATVPGCLVFYGNSDPGHVAIYAGNSQIYSTDLPKSGHVGLVDITLPTKDWGLPYLGWADPYFPHGVAPVSAVIQPWPTPVKNTGLSVHQKNVLAHPDQYPAEFQAIFASLSTHQKNVYNHPDRYTPAERAAAGF